jgi:hypothetical protein
VVIGVIVYGFTAFRIACCLALLSVAILSGCDVSPSMPETLEAVPVEIGQDFDSTTAGTICGQVTWQGALPEVAPYRAPLSPGNEHPGQTRREWPNPNAPRIDPDTMAVAGAVMFLRGVDSRRARPYDHPPVRIELRDYQIHVCQGECENSSGFVRRGDTIRMVSRQPIYHSLRVRGAAFFARAFPDAERPCSERLDSAGVVELSSGCGHFWMQARLFVDDHPYYTHSDAAGRFTLSQVPPGTYELVCWLPSWYEASRELDAETALICRLTFRPAVEITQTIQLAPRQTRTVPVRISAQHFRGVLPSLGWVSP